MIESFYFTVSESFTYTRKKVNFSLWKKIDLFNLCTIPLSFYNISFVIMMHLVIHIRTAEDFVQRPEHVILLVTNNTTTCFQISLNNIFLCWAVYGAGKQVQGFVREVLPFELMFISCLLRIDIVMYFMSSETLRM